MNAIWKARQRTTRALVTAIADDVLRREVITSDALYGLCKLTWLTRDHIGGDAGYIYSTKLPALRHVFDDELPDDLDAAARLVAHRLGRPGVARLVRADTGLTNFRNTHRNAARDWLRDNRPAVVDILRAGRRLKSDRQASKLAASIEALPDIASGSGTSGWRKPAGLLTPLIFAIDPRFRFPMINGGSKNFLRELRVDGKDLPAQHDAMVARIGRNHIRDAGDLDLYAQLRAVAAPTSVCALKERNEDDPDLKVKDEVDIEVIRRAQTQRRRRLHNRMTNWFRAAYKDTYRVTEGRKGSAMFDIEVEAFNGRGRLLIEVKSSTDEADVRMAIGQLLAYSYHLGRDANDRQAVLLPRMPSGAIQGLLEHLGLGLIWFNDGHPETTAPWLNEFVLHADTSKAGMFVS